MQDRGVDEGKTAAIHLRRPVAATCEAIMEALRPELMQMLLNGGNCKVTIHISAGHTAKFEVVRYVEAVVK